MPKGKINFDELDPVVVEAINRGGASTIYITEKFKIQDTSGTYAWLGLGNEFTLKQLLEALGNYSKKVKESEAKISQVDEIKRQIELSKREIEASKRDLEASKKDLELVKTELKKALAEGSKPTPSPDPQPQPPEETGPEPSTNRSDYVVDNESNSVVIKVKDSKVSIPTHMMMSDAKGNEILSSLYSLRNNELNTLVGIANERDSLKTKLKKYITL